MLSRTIRQLISVLASQFRRKMHELLGFERTRESISFVVCSIDADKLGRLIKRLDSLCRHVDYEVVHIGDAKSLCEGYSRGYKKATKDVVIFCHDDIDFLCDDAIFCNLLMSGLDLYDVLGVAGTTCLSSAFWMSSGPTTWRGLVIHHPAEGRYEVTPFDVLREAFSPVVALDGVFMAVRRRVLEKIDFDSTAFDGFHAYDVDFTFRCHLSGFRLGVCKRILLIHDSNGTFDEKWSIYAKRFCEKHTNDLASDRVVRGAVSPCKIYTDNPNDASSVCSKLLD